MNHIWDRVMEFWDNFALHHGHETALIYFLFMSFIFPYQFHLYYNALLTLLNVIKPRVI